MQGLKLSVAAMAALTAAQAFAADTSGAAQASNAVDDNRVICKKTLETGSLVRKTKQCFTKAEWDRIAESQRRGSEKMVDGLASRSSGQ
jgi:hypothetical protein